LRLRRSQRALRISAPNLLRLAAGFERLLWDEHLKGPADRLWPTAPNAWSRRSPARKVRASSQTGGGNGLLSMNKS